MRHDGRVQPLTPDEVRRLQAAPYSYTEVGATAGRHTPRGCRGIHLQLDLDQPFERALETLMTWRMHEGAGLRVRASASRVVPGAVVELGFGFGPFRIPSPCRVVAVHGAPDAAGFTYGTLPGHPEAGEERFLVTRGKVTPGGSSTHLQVTAFSRPGRWFTTLAGPVAGLVQDELVERYRRALNME
ncbi:MAG: hypothetical protein JWR35_3868 [Marmoricola sp.]|nr:hypothetical protein [Marmoricola sp.]